MVSGGKAGGQVVVHHAGRWVLVLVVCQRADDVTTPCILSDLHLFEILFHHRYGTSDRKSCNCGMARLAPEPVEEKEEGEGLILARNDVVDDDDDGGYLMTVHVNRGRWKVHISAVLLFLASGRNEHISASRPAVAGDQAGGAVGRR